LWENITITVTFIFYLLLILAMLWTALLIIIAGSLRAIRVELEQLKLHTRKRSDET